jgi:hypothetical protein
MGPVFGGLGVRMTDVGIDGVCDAGDIDEFLIERLPEEIRRLNTGYDHPNVVQPSTHFVNAFGTFGIKGGDQELFQAIYEHTVDKLLDCYE